MTSKKAFYGMLGAVVLMVGAVIGSVVLGNLLLKKQSDKLVNLKVDASVIEAQQTSLIQAKKDVEKYAELGTIAKQVVPQDKDQARAVREIVNLADQSGIKIASVTFPSSSLGQKAATATTDSSSSAAASPLTQAKPVAGIDGLYQLDITIASDTARPTTYTRLISFLNRLEQNRRTAQVSQITIQPDTKNRLNLNFTVTLTVYIKP
jgi:hypothetical protein